MGQMPSQMTSPYSYSPMSGQYSPMSGMGMASQYTGGYAGQQEMSIAQQKQPAEAFDEEAFARAFEAAARVEMAESRKQSKQESSQEQNQHAERGQEVLIDESAERLLASSQGPLHQEPIGADQIEDLKTLSPEEAERQGGADALQRTAAEMLEKVRGEQEQNVKFQNSQFFELMRQFRDREATVVGNEVVSMGIKAGVNGNSDGVQDGGLSAAEVEESIKVAS